MCSLQYSKWLLRIVTIDIILFHQNHVNDIVSRHKMLDVSIKTNGLDTCVLLLESKNLLKILR